MIVNINPIKNYYNFKILGNHIVIIIKKNLILFLELAHIVIWKTFSLTNIVTEHSLY